MNALFVDCCIPHTPCVSVLVCMIREETLPWAMDVEVNEEKAAGIALFCFKNLSNLFGLFCFTQAKASTEQSLKMKTST